MKRSLLLPLVPLYWLGLRIKEALRGRPKQLRRPVISVGSLSAGGAGKTPVVLALAELMGRHGAKADVLSRGYGRGSGVVERVDARGSARRFGDEPMLMACAGLDVYVGAERIEAGRLAEKDGSAPFHLLDDGFQHRRLDRGLDVVVFSREDAGDWLLPAGNLREPLSQLDRADVVVLREEEAGALRPVVSARTRAEIWVLRRELLLPGAASERPLRAVAFCGLARPAGFFSMLREAGCELVGTRVFPDHYAYSMQDIERLCAAARHAQADGFYTTEKDAVKFSAAMRSALEKIGSLSIPKLRVIFLEEEVVWARLSRVASPPG